MKDHVIVVNELVSKNVLSREAGKHVEQYRNDCYGYVNTEQPCRSNWKLLRQGKVTVLPQNVIYSNTIQHTHNNFI